MQESHREDDEDNVRPFADCGNNQNDLADVEISDLDWFGNTTLHHCFANNEIVMPSVCKVLEKFPEYALVKNQFGRIPLHYALDRIKVNINGVKKLIEAHPDGVRERDNDGKTPYDIAIKWKHSREILKLLLDVDPKLDKAMHFKLRYGLLASFYNWVTSDREPQKNRIYSSFNFTNDNDIKDIPDDFVLANESFSDTMGEFDQIPNINEGNSTLVTARGDISDRNSSIFSISTSKISAKEYGRRGSIQEVEEEN